MKKNEKNNRFPSNSLIYNLKLILNKFYGKDYKQLFYTN